jgi:hypothetical protein
MFWMMRLLPRWNTFSATKSPEISPEAPTEEPANLRKEQDDETQDAMSGGPGVASSNLAAPTIHLQGKDQHHASIFAGGCNPPQLHGFCRRSRTPEGDDVDVA